MDFRHIENLSDKILLRWAKNKYIIDLIKLRIADDSGAIRTNTKGKIIKKDFKEFNKIKTKLINWNSNVNKTLVTGEDIMRLLKLPEGKRIGQVLDLIKDQQRLGRIKTRKQGITYIKSLDI
jgi:hypothetical protein